MHMRIEHVNAVCVYLKLRACTSVFFIAITLQVEKSFLQNEGGYRDGSKRQKEETYPAKIHKDT